MSGFDDNPFADPTDPSVRQATSTNVRPQDGLENYSPFENQSNMNRTSVQPPPNTVATPSGFTTVPIDTPVQAKPSQVSTDEFQKRQEELERKAQELARREEALRNATIPNVRQNNWPPLPSFIPAQPCFYQDINVEIPVEFQRVVQMVYYMWMVHSGLYFVNFVVSLAMLIQAGAGSQFGLSLLYLCLFSPAAYVCWFRPLYKAFRSDSSVNFMAFFLIFAAQLGASVISAVGLPNLGSCGFVNGLSLIASGGGGNIFVGILVVIVGIGYGAAAFLDFLLLVKVHGIYRSTGASFAKAQQEFSQGVFRNEVVQGAAAGAAQSVIQSQMQNASQPNRY
ncbi:secretory carrier-associated membrane protein 1-like isoform X2 [Artemia franciscana]|uniref:Secretory carrier-associated membrane protein n=1 Tax=Artemia franciscana TaxID=6661 RepID=A0AA88KWS0_ARTSF|nr:hypothetical protein QYM36_017218 [Artemia franciscana]